MNKPLTIRQVVFMYLLLSLSSILRQIPTALAREAGRSGYLSPFWSILALIPLTAIIVLLIRSFPGLNIYEIMVHLAGKVIAKLIIVFYLIWVLLYLSTKFNAYALTLQFTLMPKTKSDFFIAIMLVLVYYALLKGSKTIFRFSEFAFGPIIFLITVLFVCAISVLRVDYLLPVSTINLPSTIKASKDVIAVGGNIILVLFFADEFGIAITNKQIRKFWFASGLFVVISFVITIFTFGVTGPNLTANLPFPFYITVKGISFFNIFERFEVVVTMICVLLDFIGICIMYIVMTRCFQWLFEIKDRGFLFLPLAIIMFYLTKYVSATQFEFRYFYRYIIVNLNLIFQYVIPFLLGLICLLKRKYIKKQY
ncbi:MAG: GerAB/ArcD/ProY family transporter [Clostridiales bacterium]|nr:GerAB/ArcD/ProY family transporter [Clostridiales bacterium]